jgi:hypothetical protein
VEVVEVELDELVDEKPGLLDVGDDELDDVAAVVDVARRKPRARTKNVAISARVRARSGQNNEFSGGLHPLVIPAAAKDSIASSCTDPPTSTKPSTAPAS